MSQGKSFFIKSLAAGSLGSLFVIFIFVSLNHHAMNKEKKNSESYTQFAIKAPVKKKEVVKAKPKPKKKKVDLKPNMQSLLRGMNFGLPAFEMDWGDGDGLLMGSSDYMDGSKVDKKPKVVYRAPLSFPSSAASEGINGYVTFGLFIDSSGKLKKIELLESEPQGIFDQAAEANIQTWKFEAAEHKGIKVATWQKQKIVFSMEN